MKRLIAFLLMACFLCQLTACKVNDDSKKNNQKIEQSEEEKIEQPEESEEQIVAEGESNQQEDIVAPTPTPIPTPAPAPTQNTQSTPTPTPTPPANVEFGSAEEVEVEEVVEVEVPEIKTEIEIETSHKELAATSYYQYTGLSSNEKTIYQAISKGAKNGETYVDLRGYNCNKSTLSKVYYAVTADNPQYFYLTNRYAFQSRADKVEKLILLYLDGTNVDDISNTVEIKADRSVIAKQIESFNKTVEDILKKIPTNASEVEKEKMIYDYLQDNIEYDYDAATLVNQQTSVSCHAFDVYGAACEGKAVCEGYAELFQYICYCVGINATQVYGTANGGSHMWNTVCIDSEWYMLDVTWDDQGSDGLHFYTYFDLTTNEMNGYNHVIDSTNVRVPECTSVKHAFYKDFAMYVDSTSTAPANYKAVIDFVVKNKEKYVEIYCGNQSQATMQKYLSDQIFSSKSEVQKYIKSKGYNISFEAQYYISGKYCYIRIK